MIDTVDKLVSDAMKSFGFESDRRPAKRGWAEGLYSCHCTKCEKDYCGHKRSFHCADCAYDESLHNIEPKPQIKSLDEHEFSDNNIQSVEIEGSNIVIYSTESVNDLSNADLAAILKAKGFDMVKREIK